VADVQIRTTAALLALVCAAGCGSEPSRQSQTSSTTRPLAVSPAKAEPATTATADASTVSTPAVTVPSGAVIAAVPLQYRDDVSAQRFQVEIINRTDQALAVTSLRFEWEGLTTDTAPRELTIGSGQTVDLPLPLEPASCIDTAQPESMPDLSSAVAVLGLASGGEQRVPVYDRDGVMSRLYRSSCRQQWVDQQLIVEWTSFAIAEHEGRPVVSAALRIERRAFTGDIRVSAVGGTIPFNPEFDSGALPIMLGAGAANSSTPMRFTEARCDAHAVAEAKQPFNFLVELELDGKPYPTVVLTPDDSHQLMFDTALSACQILGEDGALD
jgi:hypothetical protein